MITMAAKAIHTATAMTMARSTIRIMPTITGMTGTITVGTAATMTRGIRAIDAWPMSS